MVYGLPTNLGFHSSRPRVDRCRERVSGRRLNREKAAVQPRSVVLHTTLPTFVGSLIVQQIMHHVALAAVPLARILLISIARNFQAECDLGKAQHQAFRRNLEQLIVSDSSKIGYKA